MNTPIITLQLTHPLLTITRDELEDAPDDYIHSMRRKLAKQHGAPLAQVYFDRLSHADRAIYGEFRVLKAVPASPAG